MQGHFLWEVDKQDFEAIHIFIRSKLKMESSAELTKILLPNYYECILIKLILISMLYPLTLADNLLMNEIKF